MADDTRWLDADEQRTWRAFLTAQRLLFDRLERQLQHDAGLPLAYYEIMVQLSEAPDRALRMSQLADWSLSSRSRLSHAVARLEAAGWVRRRACAEDRRGSWAELTDAGLAKLDDAAHGHVAAVRADLFDPLTEAQLHALREAGEALVAHLTGGAGADGVRPDGPGAPPTAEADGGDGTCGLAAPGPAARAARR